MLEARASKSRVPKLELGNQRNQRTSINRARLPRVGWMRLFGLFYLLACSLLSVDELEDQQLSLLSCDGVLLCRRLGFSKPRRLFRLYTSALFSGSSSMGVQISGYG